MNADVAAQTRTMTIYSVVLVIVTLTCLTLSLWVVLLWVVLVIVTLTCLTLSLWYATKLGDMLSKMAKLGASRGPSAIAELLATVSVGLLRRECSDVSKTRTADVENMTQGRHPQLDINRS